MKSDNLASKVWREIGSASATPVDQKKRVEIKVDSYYVVIGFEVNKPQAYVNGVLELSTDYGHAFIYLVKNGLSIAYLSFGPNGPGKITQSKNGTKNFRPARADYPIKEKVSAFGIYVTLSQAEALTKEIADVRSAIQRDDISYTVFLNDTCAETSRDVLKAAKIETASGSGWVKFEGHLLAYAVNPYKWHENLKKTLKREAFFMLPRQTFNWQPYVGQPDPIFSPAR